MGKRGMNTSGFITHSLLKYIIRSLGIKHSSLSFSLSLFLSLSFFLSLSLYARKKGVNPKVNEQRKGKDEKYFSLLSSGFCDITLLS